MSKLTKVAPSELDIVRPPAESALAVHTAESAAKIAAKIKDKRALGAAIDMKVDGQRDFAAAYRAAFPASQSTGGPGRGKRTHVHAPVSSESYCSRFGFSQRTVQKWAERFLVDDYEARKEAIKERAFRQIEAPSQAHVGQNAGDNEWYTPEAIIEAARRVMGGIDFDPASSAEAQKVVKADRYCTKEQNGLSEHWRGRVWMNPPYSQPWIDDFCLKLEAEIGAGHTTQAITLTNNGTETHWGQLLLSGCSAVCFHSGRVKFWAPDKESVPLQGQMIVYFGAEVESFCREFSSFGVVCLNGGGVISGVE